MALSSYADLTSAIANQLGGRHDLDSFIPDFITLFEAAANRRLRVRRMQAATALTTLTGAVALPADFLIERQVIWLGSRNRELTYATPSWLTLNYPSSPAGAPAVYTIKGSTLHTMPYDDTAQVSLEYFERIGSLVDAANWLFANHPDVYLFGALAESGDFTADNDQLAKWIARRDSIFNDIEILDKRDQGVGPIRVIGPTP
jgi:hypothetical protein